MQVVRFMLLGSALVLSNSLSMSARASNGIHPRTPVVWDPEPACMTIIDRTVDAKLEFTYQIPYEDLPPKNATDEVDDSRRHQFIGFCAQHSPQQPLPVWLSAADVTAAEQVGIVKLADTDPEAIFETNPMWKDCFTRITPDDARRPITLAAAMKPVVWDTTGLAVGAYVIAGYTWEPVFNIWSPRPGVIKVIDDPDPTQSGPAMAITNREPIKYADEVLTVVGCVDAMDGSTMTGYWALTNDDTLDVLEWMPFAADTPVDGDTFELPFMPPPASVGNQIAMKVEVIDPMDRKYTAHMGELASILAGSDGETGECPDTGNSFISQPGCGTGDDSEASGGVTGSLGSSSTTAAATGSEGSGSASASGSGTSGEGTGATTTAMEGEGGCGGCTQGGGGSGWLLLTPWLLWARRRRG